MKKNLLKSLFLKHWERRLVVLFAGLFLLQFVLWIEMEDGFWLPETLTIVKLTLLAVSLTEMFPQLHPAIRRLVQLVVCFYVQAAVLGYEPVGGDIRTLDGLYRVLYGNFVQFTPFVWFALSAWLCALLAFWWFAVKWRIYALTIASVVFFAVRDSYSMLTLWPLVATVVFCGLFLLIVNHFAELKKKNPIGWSYLADYPLSVALPVVFLVSFIVFLGTLAPDVRAVLTDPYTLWKTWRGEQVTFFSKGTGIGSFPVAESLSGYSRSDSALGGSFTFDFTPVMSVTTSHRSYWRGETRSIYTGRGWVQSETERRTPLLPVAANTSLPSDDRIDVSKLKTVEVTQTVTMLNPNEKFPVLFGAYAIQTVQNVSRSGTELDTTLLKWSARLGELRWDESAAYPTTYTIVSQVPIIEEEELRRVTIDAQARWMNEYLFVPDSVPERVRQLAQEVTKNGATMYDKVKLLEQYLSITYPYTTTPDLSKGRSRDFVDRFLFEIREGYCDYYSTAMAVMLRTLGIPTRWVKGYATGYSSLEEEMLNFPDTLVDPNGAGEYTVRNADAHSWVEVYFPGFGWIPFEPTAGFTLPTVVPQEEVVPETVTPSETTSGEVPAFSAGGSSHRWVGPLSGFVMVALLAVLWFLNRHRLPLFRKPNTDGSIPESNRKIVLEFERLIRAAKRKGYARLEHETAREMIARWIHKDKWLQKDLETLLALFEKAKYSNARVTEEEMSVFQRTVHKLRENM